MKHLSTAFAVIFAATVSRLAQTQLKTKQVLMEGSGSPIVLLNGGTFDMTAYTPHVKLLAGSFRVIRMEQFNIEYADKGLTLPKGYSVKTESEAIGRTLDSLGVREPVIIAGHSYGGVIAFDFAIHHPDRVRALVLIEAPLFDLPKSKGIQIDEMKEIEALTVHFTPQATITEDMVERFRCKMSNYCDTTDIHRHPMWVKWVKQKDRLKGLSAVPNYRVDSQKLHAFRKPVLIVTGSSTLASNKTTDKLLAKEFSRAESGDLPGGHTSVYQNAEVFVQLLKGFLQKAANRHD